MREILRTIANPSALLNVTSEELARALLQAMQQRNAHPIPSMVNRNSAVDELFPLGSTQAENPVERRKLEKELLRAFRAAFDLLEKWQLIEPAEGVNGKNGYLTLTEKGAASTEGTDFEVIRQRGLLTPEMLHPLLRKDVFSDFQSGRFGDAVVGAFRIIELEVRAAAKRPKTEYGRDLIRSAFNKTKGPLTDMTEGSAHAEALQMLFIGALARFRNEGSHSNRQFADPIEPMQELMIASRLLRFVDERRRS